VLLGICLFVFLSVCLSVSRITQKVVDEFRRYFFGVVRCVTSNSWLDSGGDTTHVTLCLRTAVLAEVALSE